MSATRYSLQSRLLFAFSLLLFLFIGLTDLALESAFRSSVEAAARERMQVQVYLLLSSVEEDSGELYFLEDLREPRFGQLNSGLYGFITRANYGEVWRSNSARAFTLQDAEALQQPVEVGASRFTTVYDSAGQAHFAFSYGILWQDEVSLYNFSVVEDVSPYYSEIALFRNTLWPWLGGLALLLLVTQAILLRWSLRPLQRMAANLGLIEQGDSERLEGDYPDELRGVTDNLNKLIDSERAQQERYRRTLGDLAHSLKTPLAIINGAIDSLRRQRETEPLAASTDDPLTIADEQVQRMNQIVSYQLQRAVQTGQGSTLARSIEVSPVVKKLVDAMAKVYRHKSMDCRLELDSSARFRGDERDLMELLGNVLDNAYKYGKNAVAIAVVGGTGSGGKFTRVTIEDDGSGIPAGFEEQALKRGARADTLEQGQGIGLAVAKDIVLSYAGQLSLGSSAQLGGARVELILPA